jgi:ornithine carbamoyltransferase
MSVRHFLSLTDLSSAELQQILARAIELKNMQKKHTVFEPFKNYVLAMIFEKSSTRTRVSFETGITQFGGSALFLSPKDTQLGRGEPIEDTARVISRMVDIIMIRTFEQAKIERFAAHSKVPVINALTDEFHPCQLLADMQTYLEHRGSIAGKVVAWIGDGNNMCHSYIHAAQLLDFELRIACPKGFEPNADILASTSKAQIVKTPQEAGT